MFNLTFKVNFYYGNLELLSKSWEFSLWKVTLSFANLPINVKHIFSINTHFRV